MAGIKDRLGDVPYSLPRREDYPARPGFKEDDAKGDSTSREAAAAIESRAGTLRAAALDYIRRNPLHTADEIASAMRESVLTIRPRISELRLRGLIVNEGRGKNKSGKPAHRWRAM